MAPPLVLAALDPLALALEGVVPSLVVAALALGVSWRVWSRRAALGRAGTSWGPPLALGVGFFATFWAMLGLPPADWYPDMKTRVAWLALAAAVYGLVQAGARRAWLVPTALFLAVAAGYLLAHWRLEGMWTNATAVAWIGGAAAGAALLYAGLETLAQRRPGPVLPFALSAGSGVAALVFFLGRSEQYARLTSGVAAALGVAFVLALRKPSASLARGGVVVFVTVYGGLALAANRTAELPAGPLALVLAAPLCAWAAELPLVARRGARARALVTAGLVVLPLALAAWWTQRSNAPAPGAADDPYAEYMNG